MRNLFIKSVGWILSAFAITALFPGTTLGMGGDYPTGAPFPTSSNWPTGTKELVDIPNRVGGCWVNANDWFFFSGDTAALNDFLKKCGNLHGAPMSIQFHPEGGMEQVVIGDAPKVPVDWKVSLLTPGWWPGLPATKDVKCVIQIEVWTGRGIDKSALSIPHTIGPATQPTTLP